MVTENIGAMRTAVILAFNSRNAGMYSVDLAAFRLFESLSLPVDYFRVSGRGAMGLVKHGQIPIYDLPDPAVLEHYDAIVFWGDFTTSPSYGREDFYLQINGADGESSRAELYDYWQRVFLLDGQERGARRIFSVGQNFQTLQTDAAGQDISGLARLYEQFDSFMPRDSMSLNALVRTFPGIDRAKLAQGVDCALMLNECSTGPRPAGRSGIIGGFFNRSRIRNVAELGVELKKRGYDIADVDRWLRLPTNRVHEGFREMCGQIRSFDCVLTDTYHFAVNAIREGTTPVVIGREAHEQTTTVGDYKKKVLLADLGASELYTEIAGDLLSREQVQQIVGQVDAIVKTATPHPLHARARLAADAARDEFVRRFQG
jgi:hypothetical protein